MFTNLAEFHLPSLPIPVVENCKGEGVYFLKAMGYVKIGHTADFTARFVQIDRMMPEPPSVLAFVPSPRAIETTIHRLLRDQCLKNEWYPDCDIVRSVMADAIAGKINPTGRTDTDTARPLPADIQWASDALQRLAAPVRREEPTRAIIERAAALAGFSYWRTFDLWYAKARRLGREEREALAAALVRS